MLIFTVLVLICFEIIGICVGAFLLSKQIRDYASGRLIFHTTRADYYHRTSPAVYRDILSSSNTLRHGLEKNFAVQQRGIYITHNIF